MGDFITKEKLKEIVSQAPDRDSQKLIVQKLVERGHEIEGLNAEFSPLEAVKNAPGSLVEFGKSIYTALTNPVQTVNALSSVAKGGIKKGIESLTGTDNESIQGFGGRYTQSDEDQFDAMVDFFVDRYGSTDKLLNTIEKDPAGFMSDAATVLGGGGAILKTAGAATKSAKVAEAGAKVAKFSRVLEPTSAVTQAARKFNKAAGVNKFIKDFAAKKMGEAIQATPSVRNNLSASARLVDQDYAHFFEGIPENPVGYINKWGISGSLPNMAKQLNTVKKSTIKVVDELTDNVRGDFKVRDADALLSEIQKLYTREFDDVIQGVDVIDQRTPLAATLFDSKGNAVMPGQVDLITEVDIPYSQTETLRIPKENLASATESFLGEVNSLLQKSKQQGLTVSELNRVKRMGDDILNIYKTNGEVKSSARFRNLENARKQVRGFIEDQVKAQTGEDVRALNQQTQISKGLEEIVKKRIATGSNRGFVSGQIENHILSSTITGSFITGNPVPAAAGVGAVAALKAIKTPKIQAFLTNRLYLMAEGEFQELLGGVQTGNKTKRFKQIIRRERRLLQQVFPELRLGQIAAENKENQQ